MVRETDIQRVAQFIDSLDREGFIDFEPYLGYNHCIDFGDIIDYALSTSSLIDLETSEEYDELYNACLNDTDVLASFQALDDDIQDLVDELNSTTKAYKQDYQRDFY